MCNGSSTLRISKVNSKYFHLRGLSRLGHNRSALSTWCESSRTPVHTTGHGLVPIKLYLDNSRVAGASRHSLTLPTSTRAPNKWASLLMFTIISNLLGQSSTCDSNLLPFNERRPWLQPSSSAQGHPAFLFLPTVEVAHTSVLPSSRTPKAPPGVNLLPECFSPSTTLHCPFVRYQSSAPLTDPDGPSVELVILRHGREEIMKT